MAELKKKEEAERPGKLPFDGDFQLKLLAVLAGSASDFRKFVGLLQPWMFEDRLAFDLSTSLMEHYKKYGTVPDLADRKVLLVEKYGSDRGKKMCEVLSQSITDGTYVLDKVRDFIKERIFLESNSKSLEFVRRKDVDAAFEEMQKGYQRKSRLESDDLGAVYDSDRYYFHSSSGEIPTGISELDQLLRGGMKATEVLLLVTITGGGKTTGLIHFGKTAVIVGRPVVHYTFEHTEEYTLAKYDLSIFGYREDMSIKEKLAIKSRGKRALKPDMLMVKKCIPGAWGYIHLRNHLQQVILSGWNPQVVIIDHVDEIAASSKEMDRYLQLGEIVESIKALAMEFQLVVYTASQAKAATIGKPVIGLGGAAEAFKKLWPVDICLTCQEVETAGGLIRNRFNVPKVRRAGKGLVFERTGDFSICRFVINQ